MLQLIRHDLRLKTSIIWEVSLLKHYFLFFPLLFLCTGCGTAFFEESYIRQFHETPGEENKIIFRNTSYTFTEGGDRIDSEHVLLLIGSDHKSQMKYLTVIDDDINKLTGFHARLLQKDGTVQKLGNQDLYSFATSSSQSISEGSVQVLFLKGYFAEGDILEMVTTHKMLLPQLGINYSTAIAEVPSTNIRLQIRIPEHFTASWKVLNDSLSPSEQTLSDNSKLYSFEWQSVEKTTSNNPFAKRYTWPTVLFTYPQPESQAALSWRGFGNWYHNLIQHRFVAGEEIKKKTAELTAGLTSDLQKLNALFNYCQNHMRYEQVYLDKGGFIPNDCNVILQRGYADCKDYTTLLSVMAKCAGIKTAPALCFRGRGVAAFTDIAVSQFNHMILYYTDGVKDYWYDGTNRDGKPGLTTADLINQTALIIEKDNSHFMKIAENEENLLTVSGSLTGRHADLAGELRFQLDGQYGVEFRFFDFVMNTNNLKSYLSSWVKEYFNNSIVFENIVGKKNEKGYEIFVKGKIPNALTTIDTISYFTLPHIFPNLLPALPSKQNEQDIFYYPHYNHIQVELTLDNLREKDASQQSSFIYKEKFSLPTGPFTEEDRISFMDQFLKIQGNMKKNIKLTKMSTL